MSMLWGVHPIKCTKASTTEQMVDMAEELLEASGFVFPQDILGIVAGTRTKTGSTNFLRLHVLGDRLHETGSAKEKRGQSEKHRNTGKGPTKSSSKRRLAAARS
jgi:pyruvate kinase